MALVMEKDLFYRCNVESTGSLFYLLVDISVRSEFLDPLHQLLTKDIKEVMQHRKKLSGRRLDYDCKKRKQASGKNITEDELRIAEEKFEESRELSENGMINLLENDVEQVGQLLAFVTAMHEYHRECVEKLAELQTDLEERVSTASTKPRAKRTTVKKVYSEDSDDEVLQGDDDDSGISGPSARALYDFEPENEGELGFEEGQIISLTSRLDENWLEGDIDGRSGCFPSNYVEILVDLS